MWARPLVEAMHSIYLRAQKIARKIGSDLPAQRSKTLVCCACGPAHVLELRLSALREGRG